MYGRSVRIYFYKHFVRALQYCSRILSLFGLRVVSLCWLCIKEEINWVLSLAIRPTMSLWKASMYQVNVTRPATKFGDEYASRCVVLGFFLWCPICLSIVVPLPPPPPLDSNVLVEGSSLQSQEKWGTGSGAEAEGKEKNRGKGKVAKIPHLVMVSC